MITIKGNILPQTKIADFCRHWKIDEFALFGSALRDDFGPESDVDVLVTFNANADWSLFDHLRMKEELGVLLDRPVDLLTRRAVERSQNRLRREEILGTAQIIYASYVDIHEPVPLLEASVF